MRAELRMRGFGHACVLVASIVALGVWPAYIDGRRSRMDLVGALPVTEPGDGMRAILLAHERHCDSRLAFAHVLARTELSFRFEGLAVLGGDDAEMTPATTVPELRRIRTTRWHQRVTRTALTGGPMLVFYDDHRWIRMVTSTPSTGSGVAAFVEWLARP